MLKHLARAGVFSVKGLAEYSLASLRDRDPQSRERRRAEAILDFLVRMGPIYIKMGQIAATRSDLFGPDWVSTLRVLQDQTPHMTQAQSIRALERELGKPLAEVFGHFDPIPVASA